MSDPVFQTSPVIQFATNTFINVPVILQYETTPLIEVVRHEQAGFTTEFSIYHKDGTYLAKVRGARLFLTADGEKAGLTLRHPQGMTVVELGNKPIIELRRLEAAALKTDAELYTPDGAFLKSSEFDLTGLGWPSVRGLSVGNIAGQLGCSPATVTRSMTKFREMSGLGVSVAGGNLNRQRIHL